jgi:uncharacterized protein (TIRG00374 family)
MKTSLRRQLPRLFFVALAIFLLWLTLRAVNLAEVWAQLRQLQPWQVALLAVVNLLVLATFSARWWLLLHAQGYDVPYLSLMGYRLATFAVSYFTPGPHFGGEPLQVYLVTARHKVPVAASLAAVVMDKLLEMLANFTFLALGSLLLAHELALPGWLEGQVLTVGFVLLLLPAAFLAALAVGRHPVSGLLLKGDQIWRALTGWREHAAQGVAESAVYRTIRQSEDLGGGLCRDHPRALLLALAVSAVSWLGIIGEFWLMTGVLGLGLTLSQALMALVAARVAILLPLPAALGALEASQAFAMSQLGLTPAAGISLSILIRARDVLLGLAGLGLAAVYLAWGRKSPPTLPAP